MFKMKVPSLKSKRELIHCGLRNLVRSFNQKQITNRKTSYLSENSKVLDSSERKPVINFKDECPTIKTKLDVSKDKESANQVPSSTNILVSKGTLCISKEIMEPLQNKCTMTQKNDLNIPKSRSRSFLTKKEEDLNSLEPHLLTFNCANSECAESHTYSYDGGSDLDSVSMQRQTFFNRVFSIHYKETLTLLGVVCGLLMASLLIYIICGNNMLQLFFKPREVPEPLIKSIIKNIGGGFLILLVKCLNFLGQVLSIPS